MGEDCQTRVCKDVLKRLDELKNVDRKLSYSKRIETLLNFYDKHKKEYEIWMKKQEKKKN